VSVNGTTNQQSAKTSYLMRTSLRASHADAVPPVWCSTADDLVNADDFRVAVLKNDLKLIDTFIKRGKCKHILWCRS